jgi:hypothetical protein
MLQVTINNIAFEGHYSDAIDYNSRYDIGQGFVSKFKHTAEQIEAVEEFFIHDNSSSASCYKVFIGKRVDVLRFFDDCANMF